MIVYEIYDMKLCIVSHDCKLVRNEDNIYEIICKYLNF